VDVGEGGDVGHWRALHLLGGQWGGRFRAMAVQDLPKARALWAESESIMGTVLDKAPDKAPDKAAAELAALRSKAEQLCAAAYSAQPIKQQDGTTLTLCWQGRIARGYEKLAIARIARDKEAIDTLTRAIQSLEGKYNAAAAEAGKAASAWAAMAAFVGRTVDAMDCYPPQCQCEGCKAQLQYRDKVEWRAIYAETLYDFLAPNSQDTPPFIEIMRRLRKSANDREAQDRIWAHLRRIHDAAEAYSNACAAAGTRPNWRALWPDDTTQEHA
jgi:hypothetical protein